jgi:hypothetical protein
VSVDGWASTHQARVALFPRVALLRCFLHGGLDVRSRGQLSESFAELPRGVWGSYRAATRRGFAQRLRRLREWARGRPMSARLREQVGELCGRSKGYAEAYPHPGGHRTSDRVDRVTRSTNRSSDDGRHLHGGAEACDRHRRAWARLSNFRPWDPATARANDGWRSPAGRLDEHRDHDDWLRDLRISASLCGFRRGIAPPKLRLVAPDHCTAGRVSHSDIDQT